MTELAHPDTAAADDEPPPARAALTGRRAVVLALALGYAAQVLFRLWLVRDRTYPLVMPDETYYLVMGKILAGLPAASTPGDLVVPSGYSLLIWPAMRLSHDPQTAYRLIMGINALISCLVLPLGYLALRRLGVSRPVSYVFATVAVLLPPVVFYSQYAMADTPLPALLLAWLIGVHGLFSEGTTRRRTGYGLLAGLAAGYAQLTHDRGGVVVALTVLVLLAALVRRWAPRQALLTALAAVAALYGVKRLLTAWFTELTAAKPTEVGNAVIDSLTDAHLLRRTVMRTVGHLWYFVISTWGLAALVAIVCAVCLFRSRSPRADRVGAFLVLALTLGIALAAAAALQEDGRLDTITYARYLSPLVPVVLVIAAAVLYRLRGRRLLYLGGGTAVLVAAHTALLLRLAARDFPTSHYVRWGLPDASFLQSRWTGQWNEYHVVITTAAALVVLAGVLLVRLAGGARRAALATGAAGVGLALLAGFATERITVMVTGPSNESFAGQTVGFLDASGIRPGDRVVMDGHFDWGTRTVAPYLVLDGRTWVRDLLTDPEPPAGATAAVLGIWRTDTPAEASWPNAPAGWHVAVARPDLHWVLWRRG